LFDDDEDELTTLQAPADEESDSVGNHHSLASVPEAPATSSTAEQASVAQNLLADRQNALYAELVEETDTAASSLAIVLTQPVASQTINEAGAADANSLAAASARTLQQTTQSQVAVAPQESNFGQTGQAARLSSSQAVGAVEVNTGQGSIVQLTMQQALNMSAAATTGIVTTGTTGTTGVGGSGLPVSGLPVSGLPVSGLPAAGQFQNQTFSDLAPSAPSFGGTQLATLYFNHDSANLGSQDQQVIAQLVSLLQRLPGLVRIVGHASSRTRQLPLDVHLLANFQISITRADAVAAALISSGVDPLRIIRQAVGDANPIFSEAMPSGEAGNRRVEVWIDG